MARPRVIEFEGGTISLQGYSTERANQLEALLTQKTSEPVSNLTQENTVSKVTQTNVTELKETAIGLYPVGREWFVATLKYDPTSKEAEVTSCYKAGNNQHEAVSAYKVAVVKANIIP